MAGENEGGFGEVVRWYIADWLCADDVLYLFAQLDAIKSKMRDNEVKSNPPQAKKII